jgi:hypothetical protein
MLAATALAGCGGGDAEPPGGSIHDAGRPAATVSAARETQEHARAAIGTDVGTAGAQILFGDLHVHTTYSVDAFVFSLPFFGGGGAHPPADACDFARYCAAVDFFAITDHAEGLTPERWRDTRESVRQCNARAGDPRDPDVVAFLGWEWTQVGATPETHYGHKNVILRGLADHEVPARPITALPEDILGEAPPGWLLRGLGALGPLGLGDYANLFRLLERLSRLPNCPRGVDVRALSGDCRENAATPAELFEKLEQWGVDALVIPHGLAWGLHAPPGARLDDQLSARQHDPRRQRLLEIFSGHGNGEEFRRWPEARTDECPAPTPEYLPCCWQAGEIARARCGDLAPEECEARVREAQRLAREAGTAPHLVFPDTRPEDWLDCDQCRDCFKPVFSPRPGTTAQYSLAIGGFGDVAGGKGRRLFRWGFVASSDDHAARAGTGYKQVARPFMTDAHGPRSALVDRLLRPFVVGRQRDPARAQPARREQQSFAALLDVERVASFMYPGGLAAVHARGRTRDAIWEALVRREVYATSGPRILLWFDIVNGPTGRAPMGSEVRLREDPVFEVRAVGAHVQRPGCPVESIAGLSPERLVKLCRGECYHPGDVRHPIVAIEVVRVRPQAEAGEDAADLIEDPWRRFACPPDPRGCVVRFEDPSFRAAGRDAVYYVRALQEATPAINGANLRVEFDPAGRALRTTPCYGDYRTPASDDCLAPAQERAWSSPIFVDQGS